MFDIIGCTYRQVHEIKEFLQHFSHDREISLGKVFPYDFHIHLRKREKGYNLFRDALKFRFLFSAENMSRKYILVFNNIYSVQFYCFTFNKSVLFIFLLFFWLVYLNSVSLELLS